MKNKVNSFDEIDKEYIDFGLPFKGADVMVWVIDYYKRDNQYFTKVELEIDKQTKVFKTEITEEVFEKQDNTEAMKDTINAYYDEIKELYESGRKIVKKTLSFWDKIKAFFKRLRNLKFVLLIIPFLMSCEKEVDANDENNCDSNCGKVVNQSKDYAVGDLRSISVTIENNCNDKIRHKRIYTDDFISMHHFETHMYENYRIGKTVCEAYADWK